MLGAAVSVAAVAVASPLAGGLPVDGTGLLLFLLYPLLDFGLLLLLLGQLVAGARGRGRDSGVLLGGTALLVGLDLHYAVQVAGGEYYATLATDVLYGVAFGLLATGACVRRSEVAPVRRYRSRAQLVVAAAVVALVALGLRPTGVTSLVVTVPAILTLGAVIARLMVALHEAQGAAEALRLSRTDELTGLTTAARCSTTSARVCGPGVRRPCCSWTSTGSRRSTTASATAWGPAAAGGRAPPRARPAGGCPGGAPGRGRVRRRPARRGRPGPAGDRPPGAPGGVAARRGRGRRAPRRGQRRGRPADGRPGRDRGAPACGRGHVPGQAGPARRGPLRPGQRRLHPRPAAAGRAAARRDRGRPAAAVVPAARLRGDPARGRGRGPGALGAPLPGAAAAGRVPARGPPCGLMPALTEAVVDAVLADAVRWHQQGRRFQVGFNCAPPELLGEGFLGHLGGAARRAGLPPGRICVEVTEDSFVTDPERARRALQELSDRGVVVAIDDYGTGFSSLAYLRDLPGARAQARPLVPARAAGRGRAHDRGVHAAHGARPPPGAGRRGRRGRRDRGHAGGHGGRRAAGVPLRAPHARRRARRLGQDWEASLRTNVGGWAGSG